MKWLKFLKKEKPIELSLLFKEANSAVEVHFTPEVGVDENGEKELEVGEAIKRASLYDCVIREVDFYA